MVSKHALYVVEGLTLAKNNEVLEMEAVPSEQRAQPPVLPLGYRSGLATESRRDTASFTVSGDSSTMASTSRGAPLPTDRPFTRIAYNSIREILRRRFLLQQNAFEVFSADGTSVFLGALSFLLLTYSVSSSHVSIQCLRLGMRILHLSYSCARTGTQ